MTLGSFLRNVKMYNRPAPFVLQLEVRLIKEIYIQATSIKPSIKRYKKKSLSFEYAERSTKY